jgi:ABC-2 type transport system ATP-binding protein
MCCISVRQLTKHYNSYKVLDSISFDLEYGDIFGFLGPNGAGKTTTIKILTTLIKPTSGSVTILGHDLIKDAHYIRSKIGVVQQKPSLDNNLTVSKALDIYGMLWGVPKHIRRDRINELLSVFGLAEVSNTPIEELSIGQKRRLQVAREFIHDMELLFLDEPTVGLDPSTRRILLNYIKSKVNEGLTVFFTTHIMEEAEYLCNKIAIINKGKIIALDKPHKLKERYNSMKRVELILSEPIDNISSIINADTIKIDNNMISIVSNDAENILINLINVLNARNISIESITVTPPTLEDTFLSIIDDHNDKSS